MLKIFKLLLIFLTFLLVSIGYLVAFPVENNQVQARIGIANTTEVTTTAPCLYGFELVNGSCKEIRFIANFRHSKEFLDLLLTD